MPLYYDRVRVSTATAGAGTITLGAAVTRYRSFSGASVRDGALIRYLIEDGNDWEVGLGIYSAGGATLTRSIADGGSGSSTGSLLVLSGSAFVSIIAASDFLNQIPTQGVALALTQGQFLN